jgi:hypothetical protein
MRSHHMLGRLLLAHKGEPLVDCHFLAQVSSALALLIKAFKASISALATSNASPWAWASIVSYFKNNSMVSSAVGIVLFLVDRVAPARPVLPS